MKKSSTVWVVAGLMILVGCVSAERQVEYAAWQASEDGVRTVQLPEFESKYRQGWRERATEKKKARLAREEAERVLAERKAEYRRWLASDDKEESVSFESFEQKYKEGWEARAAQKKRVRLEREERERQEAKRQAELAELQRKRNEVRDAMAAADLEDIRKVYAKGVPYPHTYHNRELLEKLWKEQKGSGAYAALAHELDKRKKSDWLREWVEPRLGLSEEDKLAGEAFLSEFGSKFMPNAYANFEKMKDVAVELQQVFNEEFAEPWTLKNTSPKWNAFNKVLEKFVKARTEYYLCHDELCYYWVAYRLGVVAAEDFVKIDSQKVAVKLLPENNTSAEYTVVKPLKMESKDSDFASKYAPETYALYQRFEQEWRQTGSLVDEVTKQRILLDDVRFSRAYHNAQFKCNDLARVMNELLVDFQSWHMDHRTAEKSSDDVAKCDQDRAKGLKAFADSLPTYVKDRTLGRIIPASDMVKVRNGGNRVPCSEEDLIKKLSVDAQEKMRNWRTSDSRKYASKIAEIRKRFGNPTVEEQDLRIQRTEVTQMQWMIVMGSNPSDHVKPDCPVEKVSWDDCQAFIKKLNGMDGANYRLPKVIEWEYACRAGSTTDWGKRRNGEDGPLDAMGWYDGNSGDNREKTRAVALKEPNAWGLFDMHGNVLEWCEDLLREGYLAHVYRGGGWNNGAEACSASYCDSFCAEYPDAYIGFRLATSQD